MRNQETILRKEIVRIGKLLYDKGLIVATDGNISVRSSKRIILITSSGYCKGLLKPQEIVRLSLEQEPLRIGTKSKPSSEYQMHKAIYYKRNDINAVIHAHPVYATALASSNDQTRQQTQEWFLNLPELPLTVGQIAWVGSYPPGSKELAYAVADKMAEADVAFLANHGIVALGEDLTQALYRVERIEFASKLFMMAKLLKLNSNNPTPEIKGS